MFGKKDDGCCCQPTTSGCCDHGHATAAPAAPSHNAHPVPAMPAPAVGHNTAPAPHAQMPTGNVPMPHAQMPATHQPRPNAPVMINQPHVPITNPQQQVITPAPTQGGKVIQSPLPVGNKGAEQIQRQPKEENKEGARMMPTPVVQPAAAKVETELKNPFDSARRDVQRGSHAADYSKLTGRLYYVHADGGLWVLRYASLDVDDGKGGSVILARDRQMNHYREGDLVTVEGEVISDKGSTRLGGPLYRVRSIVLVDRPK